MFVKKIFINHSKVNWYIHVEPKVADMSLLMDDTLKADKMCQTVSSVYKHVPCLCGVSAVLNVFGL